MPAFQGRSLWVDVSTLLGLRGSPTGIPRTVSQILQNWIADSHLPVRLCTFDPVHGTCVEVSADDSRLQQVFTASTTDRPGTFSTPASLKTRLLFPFLQTLKSGYRLGRRVVRQTTAPFYRMRRERCAGSVPMNPGDVLLLAGSTWNENPLDRIAHLRKKHGVRIAQLIYDIIPVRCPQWSSPDLGVFRRWLPAMLPQADLILTISEYSRRDLINYAAESGLPCPPVEVIRLGDEPGANTGEMRPALPEGFQSPFALFVSTVSLHKNQRLLFEVWRELLRIHGDKLPRLVLVGGTGFKGETILHELRCDRRLHQHIVHLTGVGDAQLRRLYRDCSFTLFPSRYEGWGLPVAESLVFGKPCIVSSATSLPEVGGTLAEYHDPESVQQCARLVERAFIQPDWLNSRSERIRREYRITTWAQCAQQTWNRLAQRLDLSRSPQHSAA